MALAGHFVTFTLRTSPHKNSILMVKLHRRSPDISKGGSHCVKVRVLVCLDIVKLKRHGIFATCSRLFG